MRDRAWAEAALEEAGITLERVGELDYELAIRETLDRENPSATSADSPSTAPSTPPRLKRAGSSESEPIASVLTPEALARWQERNRQQASPAELAEAVRLADFEPVCASCGGARFVRDPAFRPGAQSAPVHGAGAASFPGAMPCPECVAGPAVEWLVARSNVPPVLRELSFAAFESLPGKEAARARVEGWVELLLRGERVPDLLLHGEPGRGKTHLALAAVLACCAGGVRAEFWPFQDVLREMQLRFGAEGDSAQAWEARLRDVPVLALDDVGAEHSRSQWAIEVLEALIDHRQRGRLPTLLTTNLTPAELPYRVGARAADRLHLYRVEEVAGVSMRAVLGRRMANAL